MISFLLLVTKEKCLTLDSNSHKQETPGLQEAGPRLTTTSCCSGRHLSPPPPRPSLRQPHLIDMLGALRLCLLAFQQQPMVAMLA